jgi:hypothetical protein
MTALITLASLPEITIDVASLSSGASDLSSKAALVQPATDQASTSWQGLLTSYDTPESPALVGKMTVVGTAGADFTEALAFVASTLTTCADALAGAEARLEALRADITSFRSSVATFRADQAELLEVDSDQTGDVWGPGQFEHNAGLVAEREAVRQLIESAIDEARSDLASVAEPVGVSSLTGVADASATSTSWSQAQEHFDAELSSALLAQLAQDDPDAVSRLLAQHPEWVEQLREHPPEPTDVRAWWDGLGGGAGDDTAGWSATQSALLLGAPVVMGALGGVPPLARVDANRHNAEMRRSEAKEELGALTDRLDLVDGSGYSTSYGYQASEAERQLAADIRTLEKEIAYLDKAVTPLDDGTYEVQLMLYDRERSRIVEMIGTPGPDTKTTITYSPGTGTTMESFYGNGVQQVSRYLVDQDSSRVAFVWKDGYFPGGSPGDDLAGGILEANDTDYALRSGRDLAEFQDQIESDPVLAESYEVAIGHSWGLAAVTGSEAADAHYDQVESLAGAYMPPGWEASSDTTYSHQSYRDFLSEFQDLGLVGEGRNPDVSPDFDSTVYSREGDWELVLPTGSQYPGSLPTPPASLDMTNYPVANHNLVATSQTDNFAVLRRIEERIKAGAE